MFVRVVSLTVSVKEGPTVFCQRGSGAHPASYSMAPCSFREVKRQEPEVNHSPPTCDKVKNEWSHTFAPPICLHNVRRENFTFATVFCS
jgi:hypothetical protein